MALEDRLGRVDALVAHLVDLPGDGDALGGLAEAGLLLHQERRHLLVDRGVLGDVLVGAHQQRDQVGRAAVGQPHLLAGDLVAAVVRAGGPGLDRGHVGAEPGLGHREGAAHLAGRHLGQVLLLLLVGAVLHQHVGHDEVGVDDAGHAHPAAGDLLDHERVGQQRLAQAVVLLGDHQSEEAELLEPLDDLGGVLVRVLELGGHRQDLGLDERRTALRISVWSSVRPSVWQRRPLLAMRAPSARVAPRTLPAGRRPS